MSKLFTFPALGRFVVALGGLVFLLGLSAWPGYGQRLLSFPGAEGAGRYVSGGRGTLAVPSTVFEVTSLADTNIPGTLRYAIQATASSRTIVFRVCGTIHLSSPLSISHSNTTIAGQTAPGQGICLADYPVLTNANNVIVRFVRFRMGDKNQRLVDSSGNPLNGSGNDDAFDGLNHHHIIVDHCTMSWSDDEAFTFYGITTDSMTLQWNMISEPLNYSYHFETGDADYENHGYGGIWGGKHASFHHNLFAHCNSRTPRWNGTRYGAAIGSENCDFRNNVIYDWGINNSYGGEGGNYNVVNNYYKPGPSSHSRYRILNPYNQTASPALPFGKFYLTGNHLDSASWVTANNWYGVQMHGGLPTDTAIAKVTVPFNILPIAVQSAQDAYTAVLAGAGCILPARDTLDQRIVREVQNGTGRLIDVQGGYRHGTPYSVSQAAWPSLTCGPAPADSDHDGMTDAYENTHGLNPNDPSDHQLIAANGYTNLENYLNGLAAVLGVVAARPALAFEVYPNPARAGATVVHATAQASVDVFDTLGRRVTTATADANGTAHLTLPAGLPAGVYVVRSGNQVQRLTVE